MNQKQSCIQEICNQVLKIDPDFYDNPYGPYENSCPFCEKVIFEQFATMDDIDHKARCAYSIAKNLTCQKETYLSTLVINFKNFALIEGVKNNKYTLNLKISTDKSIALLKKPMILDKSTTFPTGSLVFHILYTDKYIRLYGIDTLEDLEIFIKYINSNYKLKIL